MYTKKPTPEVEMDKKQNGPGKKPGAVAYRTDLTALLPDDLDRMEQPEVRPLQ